MAKALLDGALMFPSEFVSATELKGRDTTVTISAVKIDDLQIEGGKKKRAPVLSFSDHPKKLVLNKTNSNTIAGLHGSEARKWTGKKIVLFPTTCKFKGKTTDCIRIRDTAPGATRDDGFVPDNELAPDEQTHQLPPKEPPFDVAEWVAGMDQVARTHGWTPEELEAIVGTALRAKGFQSLSETTEDWREKMLGALRDDSQKAKRDKKRSA